MEAFKGKQATWILTETYFIHGRKMLCLAPNRFQKDVNIYVHTRKFDSNMPLKYSMPTTLNYSILCTL